MGAFHKGRIDRLGEFGRTVRTEIRTVAPAAERLEQRRLLSAGDLDPTFGVGGKVTTDFLGSASDQAYRVVVQGDGKVIVGGSTTSGAHVRMVLARYNADGSADAGFGTGGVAFVETEDAFARLVDVRLAPGGDILVVGNAGPGAVVARLNADGTPDTSFGTGGLIRSRLGSPDFVNTMSAAVQSDGRVLVGGMANSNPFAIARFNADGTPDDGSAADSTPGDVFGNAGIASTSFGDVQAGLYRLLVDGDGRIVAAGGAFNVNGVSGVDFFVARYHPDGQLDLAFGDEAPGGGRSGFTVTPFRAPDIEYFSDTVQFGDAALAPDGGVYVAGLTNHSGVFADISFARYDANGVLDPAFGTGGRLSLDPVIAGIPTSIAVDSAGRLTVGATGVTQMTLSRYTPTGAFDASFGDGGFARDTGFGYFSVMALAPDGKIVLAGNLPTAPLDLAAGRFDASGAVDPSFGEDGVVSTDVPGSRGEGAMKLSVLPDGSSIAAGLSFDAGGSFVEGPSVVVTRYDPAGRLTSRLISNAVRLSSIDAMAIDRQGRVLVGSSDVNPLTGQADFIVVRIDASGHLDTDFSADGVAFFNVRPAAEGSFPGPESVTALSVDPAGRVLVAGTSQHVHLNADATLFVDDQDFALARLLDDGSLDTSFGTGGTTVTDVGGLADRPRAIAFGPTGDIAVAGITFDGLFENGTAFAVARYHADGTLDASFGGGIAVTSFTPSGSDLRSDDAATSVAITPDGRVVVAGTTLLLSDVPQSDIALARYNPDGTPDAGFGIGGRVVTDVSGGPDRTVDGFPDDYINAVALQADGKIVVAGITMGSGPDQYFTVARYNTRGRLDRGFARRGVAQTSFAPAGGRALGQAQDLAIDAQGRIVAAGVAWVFDDATGTDIALARYQAVTVGNAQPTAPDRALTTAEDTPMRITPGASDADGDALTFTFTQPAHGTVTANPDGTFTYTPAADFFGTDSFAYNAHDGTTESDDAFVTVTVTPVNDAPRPGADGPYGGAQDGALNVPAAEGLLANDVDVEGDPLAASLVDGAGPSSGVVTVNPDGSFSYLPAPGFSGTDAFSYAVSDGQGGRAVGRVTLTVARSAAGTITARPDGNLVVNGSDGADAIGVLPGLTGGSLVFAMAVGGAISLRSAPAPAGDLYVLGFAGNDVLYLTSGVLVRARLYGDAGNDWLTLGNGGGLAIGGPGDDRLDGGSGRDVLVAGLGEDELDGGGGDDVLVAGATSFDDRGAAGHSTRWSTVLSTWGATNRTFAQRVSALAPLLNDASVTDDTGAGTVDILTGGAGDDWFVYSRQDRLVGLTSKESSVRLLTT